jgi:hypothetical protein
MRQRDLEILSRVSLPELHESADDFTSQVQMTSHRISTKNAHNFVCCIDGSEGADLAFRTCLRLMRKKDHIVIFHAFRESTMNTVLAMYQPESLRTRYNSLLIEEGISHHHVTFQFEEKGRGDTLSTLKNFISNSTGAALRPNGISRIIDTDIFTSLIPPDFVFLGNTGIKGRHESIGTTVNGMVRKGGSGIAVGSNSDKALRSVPLPCVICKKIVGGGVRTGPLSFIMAIDESSHSRAGLDIVLQLVRRCDNLTLVHFITSDGETRRPQTRQSDLFTSSSSPVFVDAADVIHKPDATAQSHDSGMRRPSTRARVRTGGARAYSDFHELKKDYMDTLAHSGPQHAKLDEIEVSVDSSQSIKESMVAYVNARNPDFFALAPRAQVQLTSVTEYVIANVNSSVILCKN